MPAKERVRVTVEMELPQSTDLNDIASLVLNQMRLAPVWDDPAGTGHLNYICHDRTMRIVSAEIYDAS